MRAICYHVRDRLESRKECLMNTWQAVSIVSVSLIVLRAGVASVASDTSQIECWTRTTALRDWETHQLTTFNPETRNKTAWAPAGETVTIGKVKGEGRIANLWMTFPGWFWQHWNTEASIDQSILKTLILHIYWEGAKKPAVEAPAADLFGSGLAEAANYASKYFGGSSGGFFCKFPMPFKEGAESKSRTWMQRLIRQSL